ncbi:MAG: HipA domain-containing protein [Actinomycetales bacterium]
MSGFERRLDVWLGDRLAGRLMTDDGGLRFDYDADYRDSTDATPMSMSLPLTRDQHASAAANGFFEALLPEHGPARERLELESGVSRSNVFGLLAYVGRDLPGAVCIIPEGDGPLADGGVKPLTDLEVAERLADLRRAAASGGVPLSEHGQWSLAGAQAKLALTYADRQWGVPFGSVPTTHIVKPAIPGYEQFDAFEVTSLRAARHLGLSTAHAWLQPLIDGTHAAVIVRYDRVVKSDGSILRVHQEDFCQALAYPAWQKYERDGGPGLKQIGALIKRLPANLREDSAARLFEALAYNYAIAGTDGHARNFSLLLSGPDAALAPLYDLNSALPYTRPWGRRFDSVRKLHSSFVLGSTDAFNRVSAADWIAVGTHLGFGGEAAVERARSIIARVPEAFDTASREVARESGLSIGFDWASALSDLHRVSAFS